MKDLVDGRSIQESMKDLIARGMPGENENLVAGMNFAQRTTEKIATRVNR